MTKILLVEDDKSLREIYGVRLLAEGYDIVSAGDGEEALAMAIKERPNLIVSDVMMPKISGFDMLDILRATTETKDIKVIMMTALSSEDQRQRGEKLGADRYLVKSQVGIEDVVRTVHEVLGDLPGMTSAAQPVAAPAPAAPMPQQQVPQPQPTPMPAAPSPVEPPTPMAPQPQAQAPAPAPQAQGSGLPQPTAPFSSPAPRPAGLGDRVLQPLSPSSESPDIASMLENELNDMPNPVAPVTTDTPAPQPAPVIPQPTAQPIAPTPQPQAMPSHPQQAPSFAEPIQRPDIASLSPQPAAIPQPQQLPQQQPAPNTGIPTAMPATPTPMDQAGPAPVADVNPINPQAPQQ